MAPACCTASRHAHRTFAIICAVMLIMSMFSCITSATLMHDRSILLDIQASINYMDHHYIDSGHNSSFFKHQMSIPMEISCLHCGSHSRKKCHKRQGKRSGRLAKNARDAQAALGNYTLLRTWILPLHPEQPAPGFRPLLLKTLKRSRRIDYRYLKELKYSPLTQAQPLDHVTVKAALLNVRSVGNKTHITSRFYYITKFGYFVLN